MAKPGWCSRRFTFLETPFQGTRSEYGEAKVSFAGDMPNKRDNGGWGWAPRNHGTRAKFQTKWPAFNNETYSGLTNSNRGGDSAGSSDRLAVNHLSRTRQDMKLTAREGIPSNSDIPLGKNVEAERTEHLEIRTGANPEELA